MRKGVHILLVASVLAGAGCTEDTRLQGRCATDLDCPTATRCDVPSGSCRCTSDGACAPGEFCNGFQCQHRVGCDTSFDCPPRMICDRASGNCLAEDRCTADVQCAIGEVCDGSRFYCVPGCRDTGDCRIGSVCRCERDESCPIGRCEVGPCDDDSYCRFGERCVPGLDGEKRCQKDERGPYCEGCQLIPGALSRCPGEGPNFCLLDRKVSYRRVYCGVDCSEDQPCPYGYACRNILILTKSLCQADTDCTPAGGACATDADCPGARCDPAARRCAGKCSFNEDSKSGFCTCVDDSECPNDACDTTTRRCSLTRKPCTPDGGECDRAIYCVNLGNRSACLVGKNCTPEEGLKCEDVRPPTP